MRRNATKLRVGRLTALTVCGLLAAGCSGSGADATDSASPSSVSSSGATSTPGGKSTGGGTAAGAGLFTAAEPWTADVSGAAVSDRSQAIISALTDAGGWGGGNELQTDFSIVLYQADGSAPRVQVVGADEYCYGGPDCDEVPTEMPIPADATIEGSEDLTCDVSGETDGQGDCHLLVVDRDQRRLYEAYQANKEGEALTVGGLFVWELDKEYPETLRGDQCTSADAAGLPIAALTPTADEVATGELAHAIRFILPNDRMKEGVYVRPATRAGRAGKHRPERAALWRAIRLKPDFDESSYGPGEQTVIAALKKYGMILSDGGEIPLTFADDRTSKAKWSELGVDAQSFNSIAPDQFEVVEFGDEIPLTYDCVRNP